MGWTEESQEAGQATAPATSSLRNPTRLWVMLGICPGLGPQGGTQADQLQTTQAWRSKRGMRGACRAMQLPQNTFSREPPLPQVCHPQESRRALHDPTLNISLLHRMLSRSEFPAPRRVPIKTQACTSGAQLPARDVPRTPGERWDQEGQSCRPVHGTHHRWFPSLSGQTPIDVGAPHMQVQTGCCTWLPSLLK